MFIFIKLVWSDLDSQKWGTTLRHAVEKDMIISICLFAMIDQEVLNCYIIIQVCLCSHNYMVL